MQYKKALGCLNAAAKRLSQLLRHYPKATIVALLLPALLLANVLTPINNQLQRIFDRGELVVVTRSEPTAYYTNQHGPTGFDYRLADGFANSLGVKLRIIKADSLPQLYQLLESGKADIAAAALATNEKAAPQVRFSLGYLATKARIVYPAKAAKPQSIKDLAGHSIAVLKGSANEALLAGLKQPGTTIRSINSASSAQLLRQVSDGMADFALVDDRSYQLQQPLFPRLKAGFALANRQQYGWPVSPSADSSLYHAVNHYLKSTATKTKVAALAAQYLGKHNPFSLYASRTFMQHVEDRLPEFTDDFYQAGVDNNFDWRLLAAMGYQESRWNPAAQSPTGVRGLMMLTLVTARSLSVNREDPAQSIEGGARYLRIVMDRLPAQIRQPDRLWMAIATYNIGYGHLEDARVLTQRQGGNPNNWPDVRKRLALLSNPDYSSKLRYGWADGRQAINYVDRIQQYYTMLIWAKEPINKNTLLASN